MATSFSFIDLASRILLMLLISNTGSWIVPKHGLCRAALELPTKLLFKATTFGWEISEAFIHEK